MFSGALNEDAFKTLLCHQCRAGRGVTARWAMQVLGCSKSTALSVLAKYVEMEVLTITPISYRSNAIKFYYYPTDEIWTAYHAKLFRAGYNSYMRAMMEA